MQEKKTSYDNEIMYGVSTNFYVTCLENGMVTRWQIYTEIARHSLYFYDLKYYKSFRICSKNRLS